MSTIVDLEILSETECARVVTELRGLQRFWQLWGKRDSGFHTLGVASYLEARYYGASVYRAKAQLSNPILRRYFGWVYERLRDALAEHLKMPTVYEGRLALPGFHLFLGPLSLEVEEDCAPHVDGQFQLLGCSVDLESTSHTPQTLSFTLPIALPASGGGLDWWEVSAAEASAPNWVTTDQLIRFGERRFHPYRVGSMAVHSGRFFHRIANTSEPRPDDQRITLQGHGLLLDGVWHLYW